jgi:hypothetical protein
MPVFQGVPFRGPVQGGRFRYFPAAAMPGERAADIRREQAPAGFVRGGFFSGLRDQAAVFIGQRRDMRAAP